MTNPPYWRLRNYGKICSILIFMAATAGALSVKLLLMAVASLMLLFRLILMMLRQLLINLAAKNLR